MRRYPNIVVQNDQPSKAPALVALLALVGCGHLAPRPEGELWFYMCEPTGKPAAELLEGYLTDYEWTDEPTSIDLGELRVGPSWSGDNGSFTLTLRSCWDLGGETQCTWEPRCQEGETSTTLVVHVNMVGKEYEGDYQIVDSDHPSYGQPGYGWADLDWGGAGENIVGGWLHITAGDEHGYLAGSLELTTRDGPEITSAAFQACWCEGERLDLLPDGSGQR